MITSLLIMVLLLSYIVFRFKRRHYYKIAAMTPNGAKELPFIGIAHLFMGSNERSMDMHKYIGCRANEESGLVKNWLGPILCYICTDPVDLELLMKTQLDKGYFHKFTKDLIGNGSIVAPVPIWRRRRKVLLPIFTPKIVDSFVEVFSRQSQKAVELLADRVGGGKFNLWQYVSSYTFDSVCETALGIKVHAQDNPNCSFLVTLNTILELIAKRYTQMWLHLDCIHRLSPQYKSYKESRSNLLNFINELIEKKRDEIKLSNQGKTNGNTFDLNNYKNKTFLDYLITLSGDENGYTNVELREEILTFTIAGTDTSAVATCFTLSLLAKYPHIQERVYQELYGVFGDSDRPLVKKDLAKLAYLERVVKESLRLFPPVPITIREMEDELHLPSGRIIPKGANVVISIWAVHRDPKYWGEDAEYFDPDRFLPERSTTRHAYSFIPFSHGPRNCPGYQYAMMSIKTAVSTILRKYKVVGEVEAGPIPYIRVKMDIMMKAVEGWHVSLERREAPNPET